MQQRCESNQVGIKSRTELSSHDLVRWWWWIIKRSKIFNKYNLQVEVEQKRKEVDISQKHELSSISDKEAI